MGLTRRELLGRGAAVLAGGGGLYALIDRLVEAPPRPATPMPRRREQHMIEGLEVVVDNGVEVVVPPLHHELVTAKLRVGRSRASVRSARATLENALTAVEAAVERAPRGVDVTVGWGLPYFRSYVPAEAEKHLPVDLRASKANGRRTLAIQDAIRFPSDPDSLVLEDNDVAFFFRGDRRDGIADASKLLFDELDSMVELTSIRRGFAGGGFAGERSLPKRMALAAGVPGAELIPDTAELFLGFTSTQKAGLGPLRIANHETLPGYTDQWPDGYFRGGTSMHVSHIFENVEAWYLNFDFAERVSTTFRPGLRVPEGTQTVPQREEDVARADGVLRDARRHGVVGHSAAIQSTSRLDRDLDGRDGKLYRKGTAVPQRADFNTLDNPFAWTANPERDAFADEPAAGVHFVVFNPTSDDFHRNRLAMDGVLPDGRKVPLHPLSRGQGLNSILRSTHRQNFLVPPRERRAFPLAELA